MTINKNDFKSLKELLEIGEVTEGRFVNKQIVTKLSTQTGNGAVEVIRKSAKRKVIYLIKEENIFLFLKDNNYLLNSLDDIERYIQTMFKSDISRDTIQELNSSTKAKESKSLRGLYISSLQPMDIMLNNKTINIAPFNGLGYFLFHTEKIELSEDTIVVGVENYQVIWFAKKYKAFFKKKKVLFVVRNSFMREWIGTLENEYIHFGDFDLAGINIYLNEIVPRLQKSKKYSMFIPKNIQTLICEKGNRELYEKQTQYKNIVVEDKEIKELRDLIVKYKKVVEQEGLFLF